MPNGDEPDHRKYGKLGGEKTKALYGSEYYRVVGALGGQKSAATRRGKRRGRYRRSGQEDESVESSADSGSKTTARKKTT